MNKFLIASMLSGLAFVVQAQDGGSVIVKDEADQPAAGMQAAAAADPAADKLAERNCLRQTGSLITARYNARAAKSDQRCVAANGRSYSREDLDSTGEVDMADALRKLDPAIR